MFRAFAVGVIAGGGFLLAQNMIPSVKSGPADAAIDLAVAGLAGLAAIHFLHKR